MCVNWEIIVARGANEIRELVFDFEMRVNREQMKLRMLFVCGPKSDQIVIFWHDDFYSFLFAFG